MPKAATAFDKRIRRRVLGRDQVFFAVVAPGLEPFCRAEIRQLGVAETDMTTEAGGVAFTGRLPLLYAANLHLRTAGRLLMRIAAFTADGFATLDRGLERVDWELFLPAGRPVAVHVTTHKCRLYHSGAVAERVAKAVAGRIGGDAGDAHDDDATPRLFVRGSRDRFTVSVDSSGPLLHKRGLKLDVGPAPIRETLAAAALMHAGHVCGAPVMDPMCGSGTFSLEAAMVAAAIPPGWYREFAFQQWPGFSASTWAHLRHRAREHFTAAAPPRIFPSDNRAAAVATVAETARRAGLASHVAPAVRDFFDVTGRGVPAGPGTVVLNPPYGRRLGRPSDIRRDYDLIRKHLVGAFSGWRAAVFCPADASRAFDGVGLRAIRVSHGGLTLSLLSGRIRGGGARA